MLAQYPSMPQARTRTRSGLHRGIHKRRPAASPLGRAIQRAGFTFHDVAHLAGVTYRMVQKHLAGDCESPRVAGAIAKLLGRVA